MVILIHFLYLLTYHRAARLTLYNQLLFGYHTTYLDGQTARPTDNRRRRRTWRVEYRGKSAATALKLRFKDLKNIIAMFNTRRFFAISPFGRSLLMCINIKVPHYLLSTTIPVVEQQVFLSTYLLLLPKWRVRAELEPFNSTTFDLVVSSTRCGSGAMSMSQHRMYRDWPEERLIHMESRLIKLN